MDFKALKDLKIPVVDDQESNLVLLERILKLVATPPAGGAG
jgi:hypothetical protein